MSQANDLAVDRPARAYELCLAIGGFAGLLSGLLGIGGAVFLVPALVGWLSVTQYRAAGTSLAVVPLVAIASGLIYGANGLVDLRVAAVLAIGSTVGAHLGARFMKRIPAQHLRRLFGGLMLVIGLRMVIG
ncbi:MAG: sulfite exporter TauE/SafE family protein [Chloroflexi bacterium]|nr:sulfite exporter TauE/SafE family protein [Chloroflexota bacterium]